MATAVWIKYSKNYLVDLTGSAIMSLVLYGISKFNDNQVSGFVTIEFIDVYLSKGMSRHIIVRFLSGVLF